MSIERIASRYAKSLLDLAREKDKLEIVVADVRLFSEVIQNRDFYLLTKSPIIPPDKKRAVFSSLFSGKINELSFAFFDIIIRKGREQYLKEIASSFLKQYKKLKNITSVTLTTADKVSDENLVLISNQVKDSSNKSGQVEMNTKVDEELIGGFILEIEDKIYDASVKTQLAQLKKGILDNTYIKSL